MNILQIVPQLNVGGVETGTVDLAKYFIKAGHRSIVVSSGGDLVKELEAAGVVHYTLPVANKAFWVMVRASIRLAEIIKKERVDIVHARSRVPAWVGFMAVRRAPAVLITTAHGHYTRHIFSHIMGAGKFTIVPSTVIGKHMMEVFGVQRENIRLIPRSVDLDRYHLKSPPSPQKRDFVIAVIGRVTPIKGQIYFLKALARIIRSVPYVKGWVIGGVSPGKDGYMEELEVWTRRLGLSSYVSFLGNRRDLPQLMEQIDCVVMPSLVPEAFGRVIVEAQASGVPVVATRVGGVVEIIDDGVNGLLVEPQDHQGLAEAILKVLGDPALASILSRNARQKVEEKFTLQKMAEDTLKVYAEALQGPRILVIKIGALGDAVLAIPSFEALRKKFPGAKISCLAGKEVREVFARCPYIDELIVCDLKGKDRGWRGMWALSQKLMRIRFDAVVDLQNNRKSHQLAYATFAPQRYGYDNRKLGFLLNHRIADGKEPIDPVRHQFRVLNMMGIVYREEPLKLWPAPEDQRFADKFLEEFWLGRERLIGINIGASVRWPSKRWPARSFARLCDRLAKKDYRVLLTGSKEDASFAQDVLREVKTKPICAVAQTTLMQLACLVRKCDVYITGDSAPLHVAAAMQVPVVALFGPTDPKRHAPAMAHSVVLQKDCPPCYKRRCRRKRHACMEDITVEEVAAAAERLLKEAQAV
jgi:lipopolysaccharide heptosyltransferase II